MCVRLLKFIALIAGAHKYWLFKHPVSESAISAPRGHTFMNFPRARTRRNYAMTRPIGSDHCVVRLGTPVIINMHLRYIWESERSEHISRSAEEETPKSLDSARNQSTHLATRSLWDRKFLFRVDTRKIVVRKRLGTSTILFFFSAAKSSLV